MNREEELHKMFCKLIHQVFKFVDSKGLFKEYCHDLADNFWSTWSEYAEKDGPRGIQKWWDECLIAEGMTKGVDFETRADDEKFEMEITRCISVDTHKKMDYELMENYCVHCKILCEYLAEKNGYDVTITSHGPEGKCERTFVKKKG